MNPVEFILEKRNGRIHSKEDISAFCNGYIKGEIPDYQVASWLMAVFFNGLNIEERIALTREVTASGEVLDLGDISKPKVDKHSTGGVGDKTSIVIMPLLACMDVAVPMMSGRGLGHTGGTLDKLASIPGMQTEHSRQKYIEIIKRHGGAFMAQTGAITLLDKKLYALRDVTGTVESLGLITASIIGKKGAEGLDGLILDVKVGNGAFMRTIEAARELANSLVETAKGIGIRAIAILTDMNEPLGEYVGNSVEVVEAIQMLQGKKVERRFYDVTMRLAEEMCVAAFPGITENWQAKLNTILQNGQAYEKFCSIINAQGVDPKTISNINKSLPIAKKRIPICAIKAGFIDEIDTYRIGRLMIGLRAGRSKLTDTIDPAVGLKMLKRRGDAVSAGEAMAELIVHEEQDTTSFLECFKILDEKRATLGLIIERVE